MKIKNIFFITTFMINVAYSQNAQNLFYQGVLAKDRAEHFAASEYFLKACNLGHSLACYNLGNIYYKGLGLRKSYQQAVFYFERACLQNNSLGCYSYAYIYHKGLGVRQNYHKAVNFYKQACDNNHPESCDILGYLSEKGLGTKRSYFVSKEYYGKACDLGLLAGCNHFRGAKDYSLGYEDEDRVLNSF